MSRKKIILIGEIGVGKTSIIRRFVLDRFETNYKGTIGYNIYTTAVSSIGPNHNQSLELLIWDTDGDDADRLLQRPAVAQGTSAILVIADVTRPRTIETMARLTHATAQHIPGRHIHLILNKTDLLEDTTSSAPQRPDELAEIRHPIIRISAKTGDSVATAFRDVANAILRQGT